MRLQRRAIGLGWGWDRPGVGHACMLHAGGQDREEWEEGGRRKGRAVEQVEEKGEWVGRADRSVRLGTALRHENSWHGF